MSENSENAYYEALKLIVLFDLVSKTPRYSVYYHTVYGILTNNKLKLDNVLLENKLRPV